MSSTRSLGLHSLAGWALLLALAPMIFLANGCGKDEEVDPYVYGTLREVSRGSVESIGFFFEIDTPEFVYIDGNTASVRDPNDPNLLEFLVADDLGNRAPSWQGKILGVQKFFTPQVYFMVKRVKDGLSTADVDSCEEYVIPNFTDPKLEDLSGFNLGTMPWDARRGNQSDMEDRIDAEFQTAGKFVLRPDHEWVAPEGEVAEGEEAPVAPMIWYLVAAENDKAIFKIQNMTPSLEFAIKLLDHEGLPFVGGVKITDVNPYRERRRIEVTGSCEIEFITYANRYLAP